MKEDGVVIRLREKREERLVTKPDLLLRIQKDRQNNNLGWVVLLRNGQLKTQGGINFCQIHEKATTRSGAPTTTPEANGTHLQLAQERVTEQKRSALALERRQ